MRRIALTATILALAACAAPQIDTPSRSLTGGVTEAMVMQAERAPHGATLRLPKSGGHVYAAMGLAMVANSRGQCVAMLDGYVQSSGVIVMRQAACAIVPDRTARVFGIHFATRAGVFDAAGTRHMFGPAGIDAPGCAEWYARQPEARGNRIAFVSWEMLEKGCA